MRLVDVQVLGLFGIFNHHIPLRLEKYVTIIHGPNGFGKTVILRMLDSLFNGDCGIFTQIPFRRIRIGFDSDKCIEIAQESVQTSKGRVERQATIYPPDRRKAKLELRQQPSRPYEYSRPYFLASLITRHLPFLQRVGPDRWYDLQSHRNLRLREVMEQYGALLPPRWEGIPTSEEAFPEWLRDIRKRTHVRLIQTDRLVASKDQSDANPEATSRTTTSVLEYGHELTATIRDRLTRFGELSSTLDRSFPTRLLERIGEPRTPSLSQRDLHEALKALEQKRDRLVNAGLLDRGGVLPAVPERLVDSETLLSVFSVYLDDNKKKLAVFDDLLERIERLQRMVRTRFLFKELTINRQTGFEFRTVNGDALPASALSSGEQHELVLLYELLFRLQPGSLVLIDEPELSLHIAWQQEFLDDVIDIARASGTHALIATHSPDIIHDHWDLTVELKEPSV